MRAEYDRPVTVAASIARCPSDVRPILERIRAIIRAVAPAATEKISYRMPAYALDGATVYFGAFRHHIGFYPSVRDEGLRAGTAVYAGPKGDLRFPLDRLMPYTLIEKWVKAHRQEARGRTAARRKTA